MQKRSKMKRALPFLAMAVLLAAGAGCGQAAVPADESLEVSIREAVTEANPQAAVDAVYEALPDARPTPLDDAQFTKLFTDVADSVESFYGCTSDPGGGLSDLMILKPLSGKRDEVREALHTYQERRVKEFENYDILDSHTIAREAQIYDQGEYVVMVMFADNTLVQDIIDEHLPM